MHCSPHSYGKPCLYGAAVCVWLWRPAQPKHGHDLHPETERNPQTQPDLLTNCFDWGQISGSWDQSFFFRWQVAKGGHPANKIGNKIWSFVTVGTEELFFHLAIFLLTSWHPHWIIHEGQEFKTLKMFGQSVLTFMVQHEESLESKLCYSRGGLQIYAYATFLSCIVLTHSKTFLKLCCCDSGWWWYQLNTNWWCQKGYLEMMAVILILVEQQVQREIHSVD